MNFEISVLDYRNDYVIDDVVVELWDVDGLRSAPFLRSTTPETSGAFHFEADLADATNFYGREVHQFYLKVFQRTYRPTKDLGEDIQPTELLIANSLTDPGSWVDSSTYKEGVFHDAFRTSGTFSVVAATQFHYFFLQDNAGQPLSDVSLDFLLEHKDPHTPNLDLSREVTDATGRAAVRIHSASNKSGHLVVLQKRPPLSDRLLDTFDLLDEWPVAGLGNDRTNHHVVTVTPEFGGTLRVLDSHSSPIKDAVVELRDDEALEVGPLRSLITDSDGEVEVTFGYQDLLQFYGRFVDRFFFRVVGDGLEIVQTLSDSLIGPNTGPLNENGVWVLSDEAELGSGNDALELLSTAQFAELTITEAASAAPLTSTWIQVFSHTSDPAADPIVTKKVDDVGRVRIRRSYVESSDEAYWFRLVQEGAPPVDLRPADAMVNPFVGNQDPSGYWILKGPSPVVRSFETQLDRDRRLRLRVSLQALTSDEPIPGIRVSLYGNAEASEASLVGVTDSTGRFSLALQEEAFDPERTIRNDSRIQFHGPNDQIIPVKTEGSSNFEQSLNFEFDTPNVEMAIIADLTGISGVTLTFRETLGRLLDSSNGDAPAGGFQVKMIDGHDNLRADTTTLHNGYFYASWWEFAPFPPESNEFTFEISSADHKVSATTNATLDASLPDFEITADLSYQPAPVHDVPELLHIAAQTPHQYLAGAQLGSILPLAREYRAGIVEKRFLDVLSHGAIGESRSGFPQTFSVGTYLGETCGCSHCESVFGHVAYLADLIDYAEKRVINATANLAWWAAALAQPMDQFPLDCEVLDKPVAVARIAAEVLRRKIEDLATTTRSQIFEQSAAFRRQVHSSILSGYGVTPGDLASLPGMTGLTASAQERRKAVARRLRVSPDVLEDLNLGDSATAPPQETTLQEVFGWRATEQDDDFEAPFPDPFAELSPPTLLIRQRENLTKIWESHRHVAFEVAIGAHMVLAMSDTVAKVSQVGREIWSFSNAGTSTWTCVATDPTGYVAAGWENDVVLLDPVGQPLWTFEGHSQPVLAVARDAGGSTYSAGEDSTVRNVGPSGEEIWKFEITDPAVGFTAIAVDRSGFVFAGASDGSVYRITPDGEEDWAAVAFNGATSTLAITSDGTLYAGSAGGEIASFDVHGQVRPSWPVSPQMGPVVGLAVDSQGYLYAAFSAQQAGGVHRYTAEGVLDWSFDPDAGALHGLSLVPSGRVFVVGDSTVVGTSSNGEERLRLPLPGSGPSTIAMEPGVYGAFPGIGAPSNLRQIPFPVVDPSLVGAHEPSSSTAADLLATRRAWQATRIAALEAEIPFEGSSTASPLEVFDTILDATVGLGLNSDTAWNDHLQPLVDKRDADESYQRALLLRHFLTTLDLDFLVFLHEQLEGNVWPSAAYLWRLVHTLVAAERRSLFQEWFEEEAAEGVLLSPEHFYINEESWLNSSAEPENGFERDRSRRLQWEQTLRSRREAWDDLQTRLDGALARAEEQTLPLLRDLLIETYVADSGQLAGKTLEEKAEWCTDQLLIDMCAAGSIRNTRVKQAVESIKIALYLARLGGLNSNVVQIEVDPYDFDEVWKWLGEYSTWMSAVSVLTYPENFLGAIPRRSETSLFASLRQGIDDASRFRPEDACEWASWYSERFRSRSNLTVFATHFARQRDVEVSNCGTSDFVREDYIVLFGQEDAGGETTYLWSKLAMNGVQSPWQPIPIESEDLRDVIGVAAQNGELLVFYTVADDGQLGIEALPLDPESGRWGAVIAKSTGVLSQSSSLEVVQQTNDGLVSLVAKSGQRMRWTNWVGDGELAWRSIRVSVDSQLVAAVRLEPSGEIFAVLDYQSRTRLVNLTKAAGFFAQFPNSEGVLGLTPTVLAAYLEESPNFQVNLGPGRPLGIYSVGPGLMVLARNEGVLGYYWVQKPSVREGLEHAASLEALPVGGFDAYRTDTRKLARHSGGGLWFASRSIVDSSRGIGIRRGERVAILHRFVTTDPFGESLVAKVSGQHLLTPRTMRIPAAAPRHLSIAEISLRRGVLPDLLATLDSEATTLVRSYVEELYFFVPLIISERLREAGHHLAALDWLRTVFDVMNTSEDRYEYPRLDTAADVGWMLDLEAWLRDPLDPHGIAGLYPGKYRKFVFIEAVKTLLAGANDLFRQETDASRARARELYRQALSLLEDADLLVALPDSCSLNAFHQHLRETVGVTSGELDFVDVPGVERVVDYVASIIDAQDRADAIDAVETALANADPSSTPKELLLIALETARAEAAGVAPADPVSTALGEDETVRNGLYDDYVTGTTLDGVLPKIERVRERIDERFIAGLSDILDVEIPDDDPQFEPPGTITFLQDPYTPLIHWPDARPDFQTGGFEVTGADLTQRVNGPEGAILQSYLPTPRPRFCANPNPIFDILRAEAEANLAKLRLNLTFQGTERPFLPQRDPALASAHVALTGDLASMPGLAPPAPVSQLRFDVLVGSARRFLDSASRVESAYFSALKDFDNETYRLQQAAQALEIARASDDVAALRVRAAIDELSVIDAQRDLTSAKEAHFEQLISESLSPLEKLGLLFLGTSVFYSTAATLSYTAEVAMGNFGATGSMFSSAATTASTAASLANTGASYQRREQEWRFQRSQARLENAIHRAQRTVRQTQHRIAEAERRIGEIQSEHANETLEFLRNQFTSADFYRYLITVYRRAYSNLLDQATDVASMAFHQLRFERQEPMTNPIGSNYFLDVDTASSGAEIEIGGIGGSARLENDLAKLERIALDTKERRLHLSKRFSLLSLAPEQIVSVRNSGRLVFRPTLELFDEEFPGQYHRRIENVRVTIVALTPPTTGIRASLQTLGLSRIYSSPRSLDKTIINTAPQRIDFTSPDNASGVFEMDSQSELLRPFEGLGVETDFILDVPVRANRWDLASIQDVIISVDYTAKHSSTKLTLLTETDETPPVEEQRSFSTRNEFTDEWFELLRTKDLSADLPSLRFELRRELFRPGLNNIRIQQVRLFLVTSPLAAMPERVDIELQPGTGSPLVDELLDGSWASSGMESTGPNATWTLSFPHGTDNPNGLVPLLEEDLLEDLVFVVDYTATAASW